MNLNLVANTIRGLAMDGVQKANSGHPGMPMGAADFAAVLFLKFLKHHPADPRWPDRDRYVQSAGHGSMLIYSLLHLSGYDLSLDDLKSFRQWGSRTPGHPEAVEFEYIRHGTQALIANFDVATGQVIAPTVGDTRTEEDFVAHLCQTVATDPQGEWIFIADQLNTHKSAGLVQAVAELCGIPEDLGKKGQSGVLHSMATRATFLQDSAHRIRLIYTPKHCSWLNQVEMWFGILTRRLLKRGQFASTEELKRRILAFIAFFNQTLAKPFRWTYIGKPLLV